MKNITTIILFTLLAFTSLSTKAQGDFQFNRVRFEKYDNYFSGAGSQTITDTLYVDTGKVLKINSISISSNSSGFGIGNGNYRVGNLWVSLNGITLYNATNLMSSSVYCLPLNVPFWLSEGDNIIKIGTLGSSNSYPIYSTFGFSSIEFNVVQ